MAGILQTSRVIVTLTANVAHSHPLSRLQMIVMIETARISRTVLVTRIGLIRSVGRIIAAAYLIHVVLIFGRVVVRLIGVLGFQLLIVVILGKELSFRVRYLVAAEDTAEWTNLIREREIDALLMSLRQLTAGYVMFTYSAVTFGSS